MKFDTNIKTTVEQFACFSFHVGLFFINFSSLKPETENNANFDAVSSKRANFDVDQWRRQNFDQICMNVKVTTFSSL